MGRFCDYTVDSVRAGFLNAKIFIGFLWIINKSTAVQRQRSWYSEGESPVSFLKVLPK